MKQIIPILILTCFTYSLIFSQEITYKESVENLYESAIKDFKELFYTEIGVNRRVYYNCPDSIFSNDCEIKRKIVYNEDGRIISDTSFIDTLYLSTERIYLKDKIEIIKTYPDTEQTLFKYKYKTTTDSLIFDSLQRPIKYYKQGILSNTWSYDKVGRIICYSENLDNNLYNKKSTYQYLTDSIIIVKTSRSLSQFDTIHKYLIFDYQDRLIFDISKSNSISYKKRGFEVYFDSIIKVDLHPETVNVEYKFIADTLLHIVDNILSINQIIILDSNKLIKSIQIIKNDTTILGEYQYTREDNRIVKKLYYDGILNRTEIQELRPNGLLKSKTVYSLNNKRFEYECYSEKGFILQKTSIYDGVYEENLICIDI